MYEILFDLTESLCERYTALTPFIVRRERFGEVMLLIRRINAKNARGKGIKARDHVSRDDAGNIVIRREARNDNWW